MNQEIRKVPPKWEHPRDKYGSYHPINNKNYDNVAREWIQNILLWQEGKHPDQSEVVIEINVFIHRIILYLNIGNF